MPSAAECGRTVPSATECSRAPRCNNDRFARSAYRRLHTTLSCAYRRGLSHPWPLVHLHRPLPYHTIPYHTIHGGQAENGEEWTRMKEGVGEETQQHTGRGMKHGYTHAITCGRLGAERSGTENKTERTCFVRIRSAHVLFAPEEGFDAVHLVKSAHGSIQHDVPVVRLAAGGSTAPAAPS